MAPLTTTNRLAAWVVGFTFVWLAVYVPLETYVTWTIAGIRGLVYLSYIMNVVGMALMLWGALSTRRGQAVGPALLAIGWSWTTATFWRATSDRFYWAALGNQLLGGPVELWLAPVVSSVALAALIGSIVLVFQESRRG